MLRRGKAALCLTVFLLCCGCGRGGAEVTVPQVEVVEEPQVSQTEEQKRAELGLDTEAGTVLGEEEVVMMTEEGEPQTAMYTRVRGNGIFLWPMILRSFRLQLLRMSCGLRRCLTEKRMPLQRF